MTWNRPRGVLMPRYSSLVQSHSLRLPASKLAGVPQMVSLVTDEIQHLDGLRYGQRASVVYEMKEVHWRASLLREGWEISTIGNVYVTVSSCSRHTHACIYVDI